MKNLLPILALLLLVGCTSEPTPPTELERCIDANFNRIDGSFVHEIEKECGLDRVEVDSICQTELVLMGLDRARMKERQEYLKICSVREYASTFKCIKRLKDGQAKRICNAQGIY